MRIVFTIFFLLLTVVSFAQSDLNLTGTLGSETEPFIAVNPANPNNIISAWMRISYPARIETKTSFDGGMTWGNINYLPHFSNNIFIVSADVSIAFNNSGTAFISYVDYKLNLDSGFVRVAKSTDGGISWNNPVNAIDALSHSDLPIDRPWIVCDQSNSAFGGRIYLVTKSYYAATPPHKIWLSISTDTANTFSSLVQLDNPVAIGLLSNIMITPTVGADGAFYGAYMSWDTLQSPFARVICTKSIDGGNTFTQSTIAYPISGSAITDTLYQGSYSLSANPANANNLVFQVTDARNGDPDILTVNSMNGGQTWSSIPVRVNDDAIGNGIGQDMSWGAFSPNGVYAVAWRDRRNGLPNDTSNFEVYTSVSLDGGLSFRPNFCLSSSASPFINILRGNDFLGIGLSNTELFANWSDNRNAALNKEDIYARTENINLLTSLNEISSTNFLMTIYPNPNNGELSLKINIKSNLKIYNLSGNEIFSSEINFGVSKIKINLAEGIYFVELENAQGTFTEKMVILR